MDPVIDSDVKSYLNSFSPSALPDRLMVLGASGMLGSYVLEFVCELARVTGHVMEVTAVVRASTRYLETLETQYVEVLRIVGYDEARTLLETSGRWLVVHAASPASPDQYLGNEISLIETNLKLTIQVMEQLSRAEGKLVYFSSGEVYGPSPELPTHEDAYSAFDHLSSRGCYGESKRAGELIVKVYSDHLSLGGAALRIYHTFGPGIDINQSRIFSTVVKSLHDKTAISLRTDGSARRSFLYNADLASAVLMASAQQTFSAYNVAGEPELSVREFAEIASRLSDGVSPVLVEGKPKSHIVESPILRGVADTSRLRQLGWRPIVKLEEAIKRTVQSVQWRADNGLQ